MPRGRDRAATDDKPAELPLRVVFGRIRPPRDAVRKFRKERFILFPLRRRNKIGALRAALLCRKVRPFEVRAEDMPLCPARTHDGVDVFHRIAHGGKSPRRNGGQDRRRAVREMKIAARQYLVRTAVHKGMSAPSVRVQVDKPGGNVQPRKVICFAAGRLFGGNFCDLSALGIDITVEKSLRRYDFIALDPNHTLLL